MSISGKFEGIGARLEKRNGEVKIVEVISELMKVKFEDFVENVPGRSTEDARYWIDSSKIKSEMGWEPKISLKDGIKDVINWISSQIPNYQNQGLKSYKPDLNKIKSFNDFLGNPDNNFKKVHIAGTNGKGSTSHMIASILQTAGYKTGLYTSPHLLDFKERIKVNGVKITKEEVMIFINSNKSYFEKEKSTFFEMCYHFF